jgi:hypothetical protein
MSQTSDKEDRIKDKKSQLRSVLRKLEVEGGERITELDRFVVQTAAGFSFSLDYQSKRQAREAIEGLETALRSLEKFNGLFDGLDTYVQWRIDARLGSIIEASGFGSPEITERGHEELMLAALLKSLKSEMTELQSELSENRKRQHGSKGRATDYAAREVALEIGRILVRLQGVDALTNGRNSGLDGSPPSGLFPTVTKEAFDLLSIVGDQYIPCKEAIETLRGSEH